MSTYHAQVRRGDKYWIVYVPEVDRSTQARHVREVDEMARDLVAVMTDQDPAAIELEVAYELPASAQTHVDASRKLRQEADDLNRRAADEARAAVRELADVMPMRDVAGVLGISHQRVHQLVNS